MWKRIFTGILATTVLGGEIAVIAETAVAQQPTPSVTTPPPPPPSNPFPNLGILAPNARIPVTILLREASSDWRVMGTSGQFDGPPQNAISAIFGGFTSIYYTSGQTITVGAETYLVAYSLQEKPPKISPETKLGLSLLNLRTIGSLTNIRAFDLATEITNLQKLLDVVGPLDPNRQSEPVVEPTPDPTPELTPAPPRTTPPRRRPTTRRRTTTPRRTTAPRRRTSSGRR